MTAKSKYDEPIYDKAQANRLFEFRRDYVDPSQKEAAKKLGIAASWLSRAENGIRVLSTEVMGKLIKEYGLNHEWYTTGFGPRRKDAAQPTARQGLQDAVAAIQVLEKSIKIFEKNLSHAYTLIEKQQKTIDALQKRMDKMEDAK